MSNIFGDKLKKLREKHFPGESIRRLGKQLEKNGFGEYFYTQLSKMETGAVLPSEDFIKKIQKAYSLSTEETIELLTSLMFQKLQHKDFLPEHVEMPKGAMQTVGRLFRKTKKKKL
jgi:hypothetical protein